MVIVSGKKKIESDTRSTNIRCARLFPQLTYPVDQSEEINLGRKTPMKLIHDQYASPNNDVMQAIGEFLEQVSTLETTQEMPVVIFQDGVDGTY